MNRRNFIKAAGIGAVSLIIGENIFVESKGKFAMKIQAVKLFENGFMTQPFAMGGEDGAEKFDANIKYRSSLQNFVVDTGKENFFWLTPARRKISPNKLLTIKRKFLWEIKLNTTLTR